MTKSILVFAMFSAMSVTSLADQGLSVVNVHRNITISNDETPYKDFYINGGSDSGLKKGQVLNVVRKVTARDSSGAQTYGDIFIPVGELKVIAVYQGASVAREAKIFSREELPLTEQIGIMTGDQIDLKNQYAPTGKR